MEKEGNQKKQNNSIFETIYNVFLFILLLPFNLFKYFNIFFYYILKLLIRETPEKREARLAKEKEDKERLEKEKELAEKYIEENRRNKDKIEVRPAYKNNALTKEDKKEQRRFIREKIKREKQKQIEEEKRERKNIRDAFRKNIFTSYKEKNFNKKREEFKIDINSEDSKRSAEKIIFKYTARNPKGKIVKGQFQGYSKLDVHSYLLSEGYEVSEIKAVAKATIFNTDLSFNRPIKKSMLVFYITQLSTYVKAGIPLIDSIRILANQTKSKGMKTIWTSVVYELTMGASLSEAMVKCGNAFPKLLINMIKTAEMTGDLAEVLDEQAEYYRITEKTRKDMINALLYPIMILVFSFVAIAFLLLYIIPQFVSIYDTLGADLPGITKFLISASTFVRSNALVMLIVVFVVAVVFALLYKYVIEFKLFVEYILMHIPIIGDVIIYNEMTMFSKTFATLINNNIYITDSIEILSRITENEVYKGIIFDAVECLEKGDNISESFKDHWAFPNIAYQMVVTGEKTGQLGLMLEKVADYYENEHANIVSQIKVFIEPILIVFLAVVVGGILLAVILPMFNMYNQII